MKWDEQAINKAKLMYKEGEEVSRIARYFNCSFTTMRSLLRSWGVLDEIYTPPSRIYKINDNVFKEDTEIRDYWAGFFHADGHLHHNNNKTVQLYLGSKDENHLLKFREFLECNNPIYRNPETRNRKASSVIRVTSESIYQDLRDLGVKTQPRKELLNSKHFWRGIVDGDGHVGQQKQKVQLKTGVTIRRYPVISVCGDFYTIEKYREFINKICPEYKGSIQKRNKIGYVTITGKNAVKVLHTLYKDSSIYLDRKYEAYQNIT